MSYILGVAAAAACGTAAYVLGPWLLRRIPEPKLAEGVTKTPYAQLATRRAAAWCGAIGAVAGGLLAWRLGWSAPLAAWLVLAVSGAVLCYIDVLTRFLPSAIIWPTYGAVAVLLVLGSAVTGNWHALLRAVEGGALAFGFFYLMWFVYPKGIGFGDVRLSGLLGGALAWLGWGQLILGMYGGFVLGAVLGIVLTVVKVFERKAFAFGPFMLAGALLGATFGGQIASTYLG
ncbi:MAG TPA: A24 family peptidase [Kribbellaceae bacterium]|nr:A24 family peptidase [Kribbellaceae bacterium]